MTAELAIIGGGVSGAFVVIHCLRQATTPLRILWFDRDDLFCKGLAYSTTEDVHLLNVRASNMSVFADEPTHFTDWLKAGNYPYSGNDFVPRKIYGLYVSDTVQTLKEHHPLVDIVQLAQEVISVTRQGTTFNVTAAESHEASRVVLALGNFLPGHPRSENNGFTASRYYFQNAFAGDVLHKKVLAKDHITVIGAGLTMIDLVLALTERNYCGRLSILSPHGYLPQAHVQQGSATASYINAERDYDLLQVFALVKQELKKAKEEVRDPYGVIDALRPHVQRLWFRFSIDDQRRFLRHLRHKWGVARHRVPLQSLEVINQAIASGHLEVLKGRIYRIDTTETESFRLFYKNDKGEERQLETDVIINCTGPEPDFNKSSSPLVKQLIESGLIQGHALSYGLKAPENGELSEGFFTLGPPLKGVLWESTAVPEIRLQAAMMAGKLI
jgi:uncharacterized NAD(P)/FAD-binding protein YdhS